MKKLSEIDIENILSSGDFLFRQENGLDVFIVDGKSANGFCEDCQMYFDLWKYGSIENAGHEKCNWRFVTEEELKQCIQDCLDFGCFNGFKSRKAMDNEIHK